MSGFQHASFSKGMIFVLGVSSLIVGLSNTKPYTHLQVFPHMTRYHQYWRLLIHPLAFSNSAEVLMGVLTMYHMGTWVERMYGTRKYVASILLSSLFSTIISFIALILFNTLGLKFIPAGPFGVVGSIVYQYFSLVPPVYRYRIFGIEFTSKSLLYIYPVLLLYLQFPTSLPAFLPGLIFSHIYLLSPSLHTLRLPPRTYTLLTHLLSPIFGTSDTANQPRRGDRVIPGEIMPGANAAALAEANANAVEASLRGGLIGEGAAGGGGAGVGGGATGAQELGFDALGAGGEVARRAFFGPGTGGARTGTVLRTARVGQGTGSGVTPSRPNDTATDITATTTAALATPSAGAAAPSASASTIPSAIPIPPPTSTTPSLGLGGWMTQLTGRAGDAVGLRSITPEIREGGLRAGVGAGEGGSGAGESGAAVIRAPTGVEIEALTSMFPNIPRTRIVQALQNSNNNTAQAVEALLQ